MSRNSLKTARIFEYYTFFPLQQAIREARPKESVKRRQKWLARNCQNAKW